MVTLKTEDLREFFKRSKSIKPNILLNIMNYILLDTDTGTLTKSNNNTWCVHQVEVESKKNVQLLIDEQVLTPFLAITKAETITFKPIELKDKEKEKDKEKKTMRVEITDGVRNGSYGIPIDPYPKFPDKGDRTKSVKIGKDMVDAITLGKNLLTNDGSPFCFIYIKNQLSHTDLYSCDRICLYHKKFQRDDMPDIILDETACDIVSLFDEWEYYSIGNYDIFDSGKTTYSFIKTTQVPPQFEVLKKGFKKEKFFTVSKADVFEFCDWSIKTAPTTLVESRFLQKGKKIKFIFENNDYERSTDREYEMTTNFKVEEWAFNAKSLMDLLKTTPYDQLSFASVTETAYYIFTDEDPDYLGMVQGFVKPQPVPNANAGKE